jgi:hypothetical protein
MKPLNTGWVHPINESLRTDVQLIEMMTAESNPKRSRRDHQRPGQLV